MTDTEVKNKKGVKKTSKKESKVEVENTNQESTIDAQEVTSDGDIKINVETIPSTINTNAPLTINFNDLSYTESMSVLNIVKELCANFQRENKNIQYYETSSLYYDMLMTLNDKIKKTIIVNK